MDYNDAINFINDKLKFGSKLGLDTTRLLLKRLGDPQKTLKFIHVAGTNGKGSTSNFIANSLQSCGKKVGLYISPFLHYFNERIQINGEYISDENLTKYVEQIASCCDETLQPTEFEVITAIGFLHFSNEQCDYVVLEVGLGGRYDATNVIDTPVVAVITGISLDHMDILGDTVDKIAFEKCGIIKGDCPVISYPLQPDLAMNVIKNQSENHTLIVAGMADNIRLNPSKTTFSYKNNDYQIKLLGKHQVYNAVTAIEVLNTLNIPVKNIKDGLANTVFSGRMEIVQQNPFIMVDGAHNFSGITALVDSIKQYLHNQKITIVMSMLKDKQYEKCMEIIAPLADIFIATEAENPRVLPCDELGEIGKKYCKNVLIEKNRFKALELAKTYDNSIIVCGSLYLIGGLFTK